VRGVPENYPTRVYVTGQLPPGTVIEIRCACACECKEKADFSMSRCRPCRKSDDFQTHYLPEDADELNVRCPYCGNKAELVDSAVIYGRSYGMSWLCRPCDAYVGCHKNSRDHRPLGTLANKPLRALRGRVHAALDPIWKAGEAADGPTSNARGRAYSWLAERMGLSEEQCHVGRFTDELCERALLVLKDTAWSTIRDKVPNDNNLQMDQ